MGSVEDGAVGVVETGLGAGVGHRVDVREAGEAGVKGRSGVACRRQPANVVNKTAKPHTILRRLTIFPPVLLRWTQKLKQTFKGQCSSQYPTFSTPRAHMCVTIDRVSTVLSPEHGCALYTGWQG